MHRPEPGDRQEFVPGRHQQCDVNYREIRRATVWSYKFHRRIDGRVNAQHLSIYSSLRKATDPYGSCDSSHHIAGGGGGYQARRCAVPTRIAAGGSPSSSTGCLPRCAFSAEREICDDTCVASTLAAASRPRQINDALRDRSHGLIVLMRPDRLRPG